MRPFAEADEVEAAALFETVFAKRCTPEQYRWKLLGSPCPSPAPPAWYGDANGVIIGQFAGRAIRFKLGNEIVTAVHGCDVMTRSDWRRHGVLGSLGKAAFRAWGEGGASFVFGLENERWGSRNRYLGLERQLQLGQFWRPVCLEAILRSRGVHRWLADGIGGVWNLITNWLPRTKSQSLTVESTDAPGPEFDDLWHDIAGRYDATVVRDRDWLAYRYSAESGLQYHLLLARRQGRPVGYLVWRDPAAESGTAAIADIFTAPDDREARRALICATLDELRARGVAAVSAYAAPEIDLARGLRRAGFIPRRGRYQVVVIPLAGRSVAAPLSNPQRWLIAAGDFDIV